MAVPVQRITGVRLPGSENVRYYDAGDLSLSTNERVVVDTEDGAVVGLVVIRPGLVFHADLPGDLRPVLRSAPPDDADGGANGAAGR
jgi:cell fate regulator YaaT (PSP1 superfamily)